MADAFENILGQPFVRDYLRKSMVADRVSHAYLFIGPSGSHKMLAALSFAQALMCPKGNLGPRGGLCGACDACSRIRRGKHPDVHLFEPEGAKGYLVEQMRDLIADATLAPIQGARKIYIIDRADLLGTQPANAFLKTLEEPPENVVFILLARSRENVLPTILSRCQAVPFRTIPTHEALGIVIQNSGATELQAKIALGACDGSLTRAVTFLSSNASWEFRQKLLNALGSLYQADDWDILGYARDLIVAAKAPLDTVRLEMEEDLARNADFLSKSAIRQIEARNKRALSAKTLEALEQIVSITRTWVRDIMAISVGTPEFVINSDILGALEDAALHTTTERCAAALGDINASAQALAYNVSPETCIDTLLFDVRDRLYRRFASML